METLLLPVAGILILLAIIQFPTISCQQITSPYDTCGGTLQCGNISNIGYPFWGLNRPAYCGHPGFELTCSQSETFLLAYQNLEYQLLQVDYSTRTITAARNDLRTNVCSPYLYSTTFDSTLFDDNNLGNQNVSLYYWCPTEPGQRAENLNEFLCNVNGTTRTAYFQVSDGTSSFLAIGKTFVLCQNSITVPVDQSWAQRLNSSAATESNLTSALMAGFRLQWTASDFECDQCLRSGGRCGSNSISPSLFTCYNPPDSAVGGGSKMNGKLKLIIGLTSSVFGIFIMCLMFLFLMRTGCISSSFIKLGSENDRNIEAFIMEYGSLTPKRYKYLEIKKLTNSFCDKLGQGGFGSVFKGKLSDGRLVAVKVLNSSKGNGEDFDNEVASIGRTSHVNIVALLGFCYEGQKRALIYEFMPNGSLDRFVQRPSSIDQRLQVKRLYEIAVGIAKGLEYLHCGCNTRILHLDIKPQNILLDEDFCPKIADFGLAKLYSRKESMISMLEARGTIGYIAPEVFMRNIGRVSYKSDVYSFGMLMLEMVGGRTKASTGVDHTSEYFPHSIYKRLEEDDLKLDGLETAEDENGFVKKMILVGLWCIQTDPSQRPSMNKVIELLEGSTEAIQVPPKPLLFSPPRSLETMSDTSDSESIL